MWFMWDCKLKVDSNRTPGEVWWLNNPPKIGKPPILLKGCYLQHELSFINVEFGEIGCHSNCDIYQTDDQGVDRSEMDGFVLMSQRSNRRWGHRWFPNINRRKSLNVSRTRWRITNFYQYTEVCVSGWSSWESVLEMNNQRKCNLYGIPNQRSFDTVLFRWPWLQS